MLQVHNPEKKTWSSRIGLFPLFWKSQTFAIRRTEATSRRAFLSSPMQQLAVVFQKVCWKRFRRSPGPSMQLGSRQPVPFLPAGHWPPPTTSSPSQPPFFLGLRCYQYLICVVPDTVAAKSLASSGYREKRASICLTWTSS